MAAVCFGCSATETQMHVMLGLLQQLPVIDCEGGEAFLPSTEFNTPDTRDRGPWLSGWSTATSYIAHRTCAGTSLHLKCTQALVHMCAVNASVSILLLIYSIIDAFTKAHSFCHWTNSASLNNESQWTGKYTGNPVGRERNSRWYWVMSVENQHGLKARRWQLLMTLLWKYTGCPRQTRLREPSVERLLWCFNPSLLCRRACTWLTRWICQKPSHL